ncbi:hypothetical protein N658DRAFT_13043 [Parathielavia hyrcaniae]|uniref:Uncharacterized protein n=1 Tax=Parathielavia hyrcaniae TaxID=113614 RepID=A0AAN6Q9S4_9PEZI|nr:hypothetical protein N658DRAFT_13043 [Parathielavia hyrcaniae]
MADGSLPRWRAGHRACNIKKASPARKSSNMSKLVRWTLDTALVCMWLSNIRAVPVVCRPGIASVDSNSLLRHNHKLNTSQKLLSHLHQGYEHPRHMLFEDNGYGSIPLWLESVALSRYATRDRSP